MLRAGTRDDPQFAVVVPIAPARDPLVLRSLADLKSSRCRFEVVVERGCNVSSNRNAAVQRSRAPILAFTDDDCVVEPDWLAQASRFFADHPDFDVVGGPQINLDGESALGRAIGCALGSLFGTCRTRHRFRRGRLRLNATQSDLTSANLFMTRRAFERWGPFDDRLWPNEETALLRRIELGGGKIAYDPSIVVRHRRRESPSSLARQCFGYGRGRARQAKIEGAAFLGLEQSIACAFLLYLLFLPVVALLSPLAVLPLSGYAALSLTISAAFAARHRNATLAMLTPLVFLVVHLAYPAGIVFEALCSPRTARRPARHLPFASTSAAEPGQT